MLGSPTRLLVLVWKPLASVRSVMLQFLVGPRPAEAGTLTFMVGGTDEIFRNAKSILVAMGKDENVFPLWRCRCWSGYQVA